MPALNPMEMLRLGKWNRLRSMSSASCNTVCLPGFFSGAAWAAFVWFRLFFQIEELEKQLVLANSELTEARTERDQFSQESGNLDDQLQKLLVRSCSIIWDLESGNIFSTFHKPVYITKLQIFTKYCAYTWDIILCTWNVLCKIPSCVFFFRRGCYMLDKVGLQVATLFRLELPFKFKL